MIEDRLSNNVEWKRLLNRVSNLDDLSYDDWKTIDILIQTFYQKNKNIKKLTFDFFDLIRGLTSQYVSLDYNLLLGKDDISPYYPILYFGKKTGLKFKFELFEDLIGYRGASAKQLAELLTKEINNKIKT